MKKMLHSTFEQALGQIPGALASEGFGILTEIDVSETLRKKLGVDFRRYRILGACHPALAHQALQASLDVGTMLPCNVAVYEGDDGRAVVSAVDPTATAAAAADPHVRAVAETVRGKLDSVLARLD
jgi:uncharacterized protein (DUF302 family)